METKINWYIEQKVWDKTISKKSGKIESFNNPVEKYPIIVNFSGFKQSYTIDGKLALDILVPTLSTKPYEIKMEGFSQEVEKELPKIGQIVWARDGNEKDWTITHFIEKQGDIYWCSIMNNHRHNTAFKQLTTKNPYEDSDVSILEIADREPQIGDSVYVWNIEGDEPQNGNLQSIGRYVGEDFKYMVNDYRWKYCSLKNPLVK